MKEVTVFSPSKTVVLIGIFLDSRNLAIVRNEDGTTSEFLSEKTEGDQQKMSLVFEIFYTISNLGGLYAMLMFVVGLVLRPIVNKFFNYEIINETKASQRKAIGKSDTAN